MRILKMNIGLLLPLFLTLSTISFAQSMTVISENNEAKECYMNANIAATQETISLSLRKPCDSALENLTLNVKDKAASYTNRGIILTNAGEFDAAMNDFNAGIALRPNSPENYVNRGNIFYSIKNYTQAIVDYDQAISLEMPQRYIPHLNRGMAYDHVGDAIMAEADFRQAIEYKPQWSLAENLLAKLLAKQQKTQ